VIKALCIEPLGLTVTEAAKGLGVSRKTLSALLNGRFGISPEMAIRLSKAFGVNAGQRSSRSRRKYGCPCCMQIYLLAQFGTGNAIKAYAGLSSLYGQFSMHLRRHPDHEFSAKVFTCNWFGNRLIGFPMRSRRGKEQGKRVLLNYFTSPLNGAKKPGDKNKTDEPAVSCRHLKNIPT
jgi:transcriptional regulator with XRE-family HTH domain